VLVKWWLLAIPHYIVIGFFEGGGWFLGNDNNGRAAIGFGLIGWVTVFAGVALLFTARYPRGLFDFVMGMNRWVYRVIAYATLMTDRYPPFTFDAGANEPGPLPPPTVPGGVELTEPVA
jgi:membrane protease YdiL (CAAX protease family)